MLNNHFASSNSPGFVNQKSISIAHRFNCRKLSNYCFLTSHSPDTPCKNNSHRNRQTFRNNRNGKPDNCTENLYKSNSSQKANVKRFQCYQQNRNLNKVG